jgi:hypothetical protein
MVKEIIQIKLDELQEELEQKVADRLNHGKGPDPPSLSELVNQIIISMKMSIFMGRSNLPLIPLFVFLVLN